MRNLLAAALVFALAASVSAGDIDMNLSNPKPDQAVGAKPRPNASVGLKAIDASLAQAAAQVKELQAVLLRAEATLKGGNPDAKLNYRDLYIKKLETDCRGAFKAGDVVTASSDLTLRAPVSRYLACQALASGQTAACTVPPPATPAGAQPVVETPTTACVDAYYLMRFADAAITGKDAAAVCRQASAALGGGADSCAAATAGKCETFRGMKWRPFDEKGHCDAVFGAIAGTAGSCGRYKGDVPGYTCADVAALRAARKGGSCGGSALCAVTVTGKLESCQPLFAAVSEGYCKAMVSAKAKREESLIDAAAKEWRDKNPGPRVAAMNEVVAKRTEVDSLLVAIGVALDGHEPKDKEQYPARFARFKDIRKDADGALKRFKLATEAPAKPKAP